MFYFNTNTLQIFFLFVEYWLYCWRGYPPPAPSPKICPCSDIISLGNQWWHHEMLAVSSCYIDVKLRTPTLYASIFPFTCWFFSSAFSMQSFVYNWGFLPWSMYLHIFKYTVEQCQINTIRKPATWQSEVTINNNNNNNSDIYIFREWKLKSDAS